MPELTHTQIAARIRDALYEIEAGTERGVAKGMQMLDTLVGELEQERPADA
jgi:hypothetical protein